MSATGLSDADNCSPNFEGSAEKTESNREESSSPKEVLKNLRRYGISRILSYGLLNTAYYLTTFLVVWALALAPFVDRGKVSRFSFIV